MGAQVDTHKIRPQGTDGEMKRGRIIKREFIVGSNDDDDDEDLDFYCRSISSSGIEYRSRVAALPLVVHRASAFSK